MQRSPEKQARAEAILGELAELGLMLARELAAQARAAENADEAIALAGAFQKTSRAVRLTLALDLKLERDSARLIREDQQIALDCEARAAEARDAEAHDAEARALARQRPEPDPACAPPAPVERQKRSVRRLLNRLLWNEAESDLDEYELLTEDLEVRLDEAARAAGFAELSVDVLTQRLKADMQLGGDLVFTDAAAFEAMAARPRPQLSDTG